MKCMSNADINMNICLLNSRNNNTSSHTLEESVRQNTNEDNQNLETSELFIINYINQ